MRVLPLCNGIKATMQEEPFLHGRFFIAPLTGHRLEWHPRKFLRENADTACLVCLQDGQKEQGLPQTEQRPHAPMEDLVGF